MRRNPFAELGSGHRILKTAGATRHRERMRNVPVWANDNERIKQYIRTKFPKMDIDPTQRKLAARTVRLIYLYYVEGSTAAQVAEALGMTRPAVDMAVYRLRKLMTTPPRPRGRPRKCVSIEGNSGSVGDEGHTTL